METTLPKKQNVRAGLLLVTTLFTGLSLNANERHAHTGACGDFDNFINAQWKTENPVPPTESRWGSFNILNKSNEEKCKGLISDLLDKQLAKGSYQQQIADLYRSLLDVRTKNERGLQPLAPYFTLIDNAQTFDDLLVVSAIVPGTAMPIAGVVEADLMNSKFNTFYLGQTGLSLNDREFYLSDAEDKKKIREEYLASLTRTEQLLGLSAKQAAKTAEQIYNIEYSIAQAHQPKEVLRDPYKIYNKVSYADLKKQAPGINWDGYFLALGIKPSEVILQNPDIVKSLSKIAKAHSLESWKAYMKWHLVSNMAAYLPEKIEQENFAFFATTLNGIKQPLPLQERSVRRLNNLFGEPVGRLFVSKYFPAQSKAKVEQMIENMRAAFADRIQSLEWMSGATKQEALNKLKSFTYKIGYPNKWTDYAAVDIQADKAFENVMRLKNFEMRKSLSEYGKMVDTEKWEMSPHTVNAYYNPMNNEIVFPAGILQPPFFDPNTDDAVNYGAIGAVIGHEFSHGFDDQGSQFDAEGNLRDWWTAEDRERFKQLTGKLAQQYSNFEILPDLKVNGEFTLGENIADQGGVILGYYALLKAYEGKPAPPLVDGMDYKQRFFYGWAQVWRHNSTEEALRQLIALDPHSPAKARINVTLSNLDEFYDAFNCGDTPEVPKDNRVIIW